MAKNRKREGALLRLLPLTKGLVICGIIASVGFGYVWQKNLIYKLGDDIKLGEQHLDALRKRNNVLVDQVARLKSPGVLEAKCRMWSLGLGLPRESQIVRVPDPMLASDQIAHPGELQPIGGPDRPSVFNNRLARTYIAREVRTN